MSATIDHVVVMVMENRSFDHLLGYFTNIIPGLQGLQGSETNPGDPQRPAARVSPAIVPDAYTRGPDPGHEPDNVARQLFGIGAQTFNPTGTPTNNGFVLDYALRRDPNGPIGTIRAESIMECFTSAQLPGVTALATQGIVCDNWFSSVPGPTWPNRFFIHCASSGGLNRSPTNGEIIAAIEGNKPYRMPTIYQALDRAKLSWRIYYDTVSQSMALQYVGNMRDEEDCFGDLRQFLTDCAEGTLPNYAFIEPKQWAVFSSCNDMHPSHDVRLGDNLIATVHDALIRSKNWDRTLFVLLFDEHGGFFDHVPPPGALDPATPPDVRALVVNPDGKTGENGFAFDRFGIRVPCILLSPALATVGPDHTVYDHSSLIASIRKLFGIAKPLSKRDGAANDFCHLLGAAPGAPMRTAATRVAAPGPVAHPLPLPSYEDSLLTLSIHLHHGRATPHKGTASKRSRARTSKQATKPSSRRVPRRKGARPDR
jgi:phospholipase C